MRVLLVNALYYPNVLGGAERMVQTLAGELRARGNEVAVACLAEDRRARVESVEGTRVHYVPLDNVYPLGAPEDRPAALKPLWHLMDCANPLMARKLARIIQREEPDVVHTHNVTGFSTLAWRAANSAAVPVVHTLHDHHLLCIRATMFAHGRNCDRQHLACAAFSLPKKRASRHVDAVVGVSRFVLERHRDAGAFPGVPSRVIPNATRFPVQERRADFSTRRPLRVAFLGRLEPPKGVEPLLREIVRVDGDWELSLAGSGTPDYVDRLKQRFDDHRIRFLGNTDAAQVLSRADVVVVPSLSNDVSPLVIYEAFAFGVPVIGSLRGGIPELVEPGLTGEVFEPTTDGALAAVIARYAADRSALLRMSVACQARASDLQPAVNAERYESLYDEVRFARASSAAV